MKKKAFISVCIFVICFLFFVGCFFGISVLKKRHEYASLSSYINTSPDDTLSESESLTEKDSVTEPESLSETQPEVYICPIDFEELQEANPDIYAWLEIPDSEINYPILQHPSKDEYYLSHDWEGNKASSGAVFSERTYNSTDFQDPLTALYGHRLRAGGIFSTLEELYSDRESFDKHRFFTVYMPDRKIDYKVIASLPFDNRHILYYNDFSDTTKADAFFKEVFATKSLNANFDSDFSYNPDCHYLLLSTCLWADKYQRYLVIAQEIDGGQTQ